MKWLLVLLLCLTGCDVVDFQNQFREHPAMNLPVSMRQHNWSQGSIANGSCVVASTMNLLTWQGRRDIALRLKRKYGGGQEYSGWNAILDSEGIRYASTYKKNDVAFLEKAIATRRGCMTGIFPNSRSHDPNHMVCLVDLTETKACILGDNFPNKYLWVDRKEFLDEWRNANSWALTPIYTPTSPRLP